MSLFASQRERRLWAWTLAVVVAIYSTLGLAPSLAGVLRDSGLLNVCFVIGMLLILAAIVTQGWKRTPGGFELAVGLGVAAVYLLLFIRMAIPEERTHLIEYGVVALLIYESLLERASHGRNVPRPWLLAILATALLGTIDECIQAVLPSRVFDARDLLFNTLAAVMAVGASGVISWARRRPRK